MAINFNLTEEQERAKILKAAETKKEHSRKKYRMIVEKTQGLTPTEAAKVMGVSRATIQRARQWRDKGLLD